MSNIKLKPCPSPQCELEDISLGQFCREFFVQCGNCCMNGPYVMIKEGDESNQVAKDEAARLWNLLPREVEWISVEDGPEPPHDERVLACAGEEVAFAYKTEESRKWIYDDDNEYFCGVTHYQPLPTPPSEKEI